MSAGGRGVNTPGVKKLLEAEAKAAELVKKARNQKQVRMKQARDEAEAEINAYRSQREQEFQRKQTANAGNTGDVAAKIKKDTEVKLSDLEKSVTDNKQQVIQKLLDIVCQVDPQLHINFAARK
eukprot:m.220082 g.220082  ORF g.220082 m.220082 type:complete len:124 (-) comp10305_c0_seq1:638-1009(-)